MKKALLLLLLIFMGNLAIAQDFDEGLEKLAENIAKKINQKDSKKIAVWGFTTENSERTPLGNYITEDFSVYITNFGESFEVIDRNHLDILLKEHKLNSDGYIDSETAKKLGKIIAVDVIVTGTYTVVGSKVKVRAKALDTETALQFGAAIANLKINEDISSYLGISVNGTSNSNKGFNRPINSNESYNDPKTVNRECSKAETGDICFFNSNKEKMVLFISLPRQILKKSKPIYVPSSEKRKMIFLEPGETKCLYNMHDVIVDYYVIGINKFNSDELKSVQTILPYRKNLHSNFKDIGQLNIETYKSKTFTIK